MTKIALTAAAILVATGTAFAAGSDHYGDNNVNQPVANVDNSYTASIKKSDAAQHNVNVTTQSQSGQGIWGR